MSIPIRLNGRPHDLAGPTTALDLVAEVTGKELGPDGSPADGSRLGVALAVDGEVIRRGQWAEHSLSAGATVDIVTAVQGG